MTTQEKTMPDNDTWNTRELLEDAQEVMKGTVWSQDLAAYREQGNVPESFLNDVDRLTKIAWCLAQTLCEQHDGWRDGWDDEDENLWGKYLWFFAVPAEKGAKE